MIDDDQFNFENGMALESESFLNRKAWQVSPGGGGPLIAHSAEKRLPPQTYKAEFLFYNPSGIRGDIGEAEILVWKDGTEERTAFPLRLEDPGADRFSRAVLSFKIASYAGRIGFRLKLSKRAGVAFDRLIIAPDLRAFLADEFAMFQDYLKWTRSENSFDYRSLDLRMDYLPIKRFARRIAKGALGAVLFLARALKKEDEMVLIARKTI